MRWPWRRRPKPNVSSAALPVATRRIHRSDPAGTRAANPADPVLAFAQACLQASGARTQHDGAFLVATLPGGTSTRYTSTADALHADAVALIPGGTVLAGMVREAAEQTRASVLSLPAATDPDALARRAVVVPPKGCGRCVSASGEGRTELCDACPVRAGGGGFVLAETAKPPRMQRVREWTAWSVELTFRVSARERTGRTEEYVRLALDAQAGRRVEPLTLQQAEMAAACLPPPAAGAMAEAALQRAQALLQPAVDAASAFLRQRAAQPYRERVRAVTATYERLRREQPEEERAVAQALSGELAALAAIHAVELRAELESISFVASPQAEAQLTFHGGTQTSVALDLGRGIVEGRCASCNRVTTRGAVCVQGHITCASCLPGCTVCAGRSDRHQKTRRQATRGTKAVPEMVTGEQLTALATYMPRLYAQCMRWLLAQSGYLLEPDQATDGGSLSRGTQGDQRVLVVPVNVPAGLALEPADVRQAAALAEADAGPPHVLLLSSEQASPDARALASELGVVLWDRDDIAASLARITRRDVHQMRQARGEAKRRAAVAVKTRTHLLAALDRSAEALEGSSNSERAVGQAALTAALADLTAARQAADQAFLAWETLVADWLAAFDEQPNAEGALAILADEQRLRSVRARAAPLSTATQGIFERFRRTPAEGEMGYAAWRSALLAEYAARCAALRARVAVVEAAAWEDADRARDPGAALVAEHAAQEARHATARAAQAYAQVARLAGK